VDDGDGIRKPTFEAYMACLPKRNPSSTRLGGIKKVAQQVVIVDVREFRSALPSFLHKENIKVIPVTLEVGDYILTPHICVERKSLPDLIGSFASGRLFHQMEIMCRHYKLPVLLVEFDQERSFYMYTNHQMGDTISSKDIISKMCLLIMHFPQMRLVWSRGAQATASQFLNLKKNREEPLLDQAVVVGTDKSIVDLEEGTGNAMTPYDMLCKIPGITHDNVRAVTQKASCLADLAKMSKQEMTQMVGKFNAKKLYRFFNEDRASMFL